jgi:hypothetical protein
MKRNHKLLSTRQYLYGRKLKLTHKGHGISKNIPHSLGRAPELIIVKRLFSIENQTAHGIKE